MSRFGRSNQELLALEICPDMAVFVVRIISAVICLPYNIHLYMTGVPRNGALGYVTKGDPGTGSFLILATILWM